jgi:RNA polymerase sigma-70 factor (ECF subfamily)
VYVRSPRGKSGNIKEAIDAEWPPGDTSGMAQGESTCWTVIQAAAAGSAAEREEFARRYDRVVRAYLAARWRNSPCLRELDDAVQEVFVECFKQGGMLQRAEQGRPGGFRAFLYGVVRNVALRAEAGRARLRPPAERVDLDRVEADEDSLSRAFDRAWAKALLREAGRRQEEVARGSGEAACRRVELLRLRFQEGLPIRAIAERWGQDAAVLHREYAKARQEFKVALREVVAFHHPGSPVQLEQTCAELLQMLG